MKSIQNFLGHLDKRLKAFDSTCYFKIVEEYDLVRAKLNPRERSGYDYWFNALFFYYQVMIIEYDQVMIIGLMHYFIIISFFS